MEDLHEKVRYYLAHPNEREEIARRVLREHTYKGGWRN
jgi:spore maturation protein CgeB